MLNMEIHVLIGVLLACTAAGLPTKEEALLPDDTFTSLDDTLFGDEVAYVYDDNKNLVRLKLNGDDGEYILDIPENEIPNRVSFYLFTKDNPTNPRLLYVNDEDALRGSKFDPAKPTRIVTHGWINSRNSDACTLIRDAFLRHGDYNVIVFDWSSISIGEYFWAKGHVVKVARFVATMINFLVKHGMDPSQTILVGHSLGAHVVGIAARTADSDIGYIVGLDPALPGFALAGSGARISSGDAKYVEIIHTNGGLLGFLVAIGDVDYYPNGGKKQIGCLVDPGGACSHARSYKFYAESLNSQVGFHGRHCSSYGRFKLGLCNNERTSIMGGNKPLFSANGNFYLTTKWSSPFANGLFGTRH
ncbi:PREDICTED: pancreatic triacylglycerol lipase-like [Wasmannia auropunctata]|uniref:pancreatic triacylglycerol lipase-like n=1 Tax=Wasmannia auropunctata TaxID=64793 RepID=UPI0005EFBD4F|nr:PREDICTED: pancreatic triacylglycerol lipase-like [Wasmannia auropunctata]